MTEQILFVKTERLTFGQAMELARRGGMVARAGWNGRNMFVFMRPGDQITVLFLQNIKSLPECVKEYYKRDFSGAMDHGVTFSPCLCLKAADDTIVNGWLASQTDILATDWHELVFEEELHAKGGGSL